MPRHLLVGAGGDAHHGGRDLPAAGRQLLAHGGEVTRAAADLGRFLDHGADDGAEPRAHVVHRAGQPVELGGHLAQQNRPEIAGAEAVRRAHQATKRHVDRAHRAAEVPTPIMDTMPKRNHNIVRRCPASFLSSVARMRARVALAQGERVHVGHERVGRIARAVGGVRASSSRPRSASAWAVA